MGVAAERKTFAWRQIIPLRLFGMFITSFLSEVSCLVKKNSKPQQFYFSVWIFKNSYQGKPAIQKGENVSKWLELAMFQQVVLKGGNIFGMAKKTESFGAFNKTPFFISLFFLWKSSIFIFENYPFLFLRVWEIPVLKFLKLTHVFVAGSQLSWFSKNTFQFIWLLLLLAE